MRLLIISFVLLCNTLHNGYAQEAPLSPIDKQAKHTPIWVNYNTKRLSHHLTSKCVSDEEKVRSISFWITEHIAYDAKRFRRGIEKKQTPRKTLFRRKAICAHYAELFNELCRHSGITAVMVDGYSMGLYNLHDDILHTVNHSWNMVKIDTAWYLLDLTFASGHLAMKPFFHERLRALFKPGRLTKSKLIFKKARNDDYYKTPPPIFLRDHLPSTHYFQLLAEPLSLANYEEQKLQFNPNTAGGVDAELDKLFFSLAAEDPATIIGFADSAFAFNCRNILYQSGEYCKAGSKLLAASTGNGKKTGVDIAQIHSAFKYLDSSNKMLPNARKMLAEEAYYKTRKNLRRKEICYYYITQAQKGCNSLLNAANTTAGNRQKIKRLKKQNRQATRLIRSYQRKDISRIRTLSFMSKQKADSVISVNNSLIAKNVDTVLVKANTIDSCYTRITHSNIQQLIQNQDQIDSLSGQTLQLSQISVGLRRGHYDNLDAILKNNNEQRYPLVDSLLSSVFYRKPLRDSVRLNNKIIYRNMAAIKKHTTRCITLMKKNKRLGYYDANQFNNVKQNAIAALTIIQQKNDLLIEFTKQEKNWGSGLQRSGTALNEALSDEKIFEQSRYQFRSDLINKMRKKRMKDCSAILRINSQNKKAAGVILRKYQ